MASPSIVILRPGLGLTPRHAPNLISGRTRTRQLAHRPHSRLPILRQFPGEALNETPRDAQVGTADEFAALSPATVSGRGIWALADQGVVSLGNCVTNFLL